MAKQLMRKIDLARMGKITSSSMGHKCRPGGAFHRAVDKKTGLIDISRPEVQEWLANRDSPETTKYYNKATRAAKGIAEKIVIGNSEISENEFLQMRVQDVLDSYGSIQSLHDYVKTRKAIVETEFKKMQMEQARGELISRAQTAAACFGVIGVAFTRLLEMPIGSIERIAGLLSSGVPDAKQEAQELLTNQISKIIKSAKTEIEKLLDTKELEHADL